MALDPAVVEEVVAAARADSVEVAKLPPAENRRHVEVMLAAGLAAFVRPGEPSEPDFEAAALLGADRAAQGVPLTALLRGVQAGRIRAVQIAMERARAAGVPAEVMLEVLLESDRYTGALERHVITGYHDAELELARTARDARTQLLRRLLLSDACTLSADELAETGLLAKGQYHCVLSDVTDPLRARALERQLATTPGIFGLVDGKLTGIATRLPTSGLLDAQALVVVAPQAPLHRIRPLYALSLNALGTADELGLRGLHHVTDLAGQSALAAQPAMADLLSRTLLGALDPSENFHRQLAATVLAYLDHGQRFDRTATALHVHPNTIRYRLTRFEEMVGSSLEVVTVESRTAVMDTLHWWWALRTWLERR
ncbi:helix-turn-helix domain-containing protein [Streptomyces sp. H10-C2]|uniref:PucR family transcriptional regulator n=1 Tax=unclassified Streptomyces TaxID=2593676 RepID=UPI0024BBB93A|nr:MULTISPECIES: PucR family transcriptional regulator [unclassified Streptomyces]MDJ0345671.1 helix-turn-helix domain-containing protein [Streptomyces sp. PH10-H1]MDJ0374523.1 helix-turn-helix domain-containing protein [Streptomyces sp. H10-C2]